MNQEQQNILFNNCFTYLYNKQLVEIKKINSFTESTTRNLRLNNLVDEEEQWLIDNCTSLFFIEKSSDIIQNYINNFNIDKMFIEIIEYYKKNGINIYETNKEGQNALRIINLKKIEFVTTDALVIDEIYYNNIESVVRSILGKEGDIKNLNVDFSSGQEFIFSLTLSFLNGGHYALICCKYENSEWVVCLIDPYTKTYINVFEKIITDIIVLTTKRLNKESFYFGTFTNKINLNIGSGIQEMSYVDNKKPETPLEMYNIQTPNNQDHFCFMWCIYFFEKFLIYRWQNNLNFNDSIHKIIDDVNDISKKTFVNKLLTIKQYIIDLTEKNIIELSGSSKIFFDTYFPCIWYDNSVNNLKIVTKSIFNEVNYNYKNFTLYKIENNMLNLIEPVDFLYKPFINFNNIIYLFSVTEKIKIFNSLTDDIKTKFNISNTDNIVKIFYCKLFDILITNFLQRNIVIPENYYNNKVTNSSLRYFVDNNINIDISNKEYGCESKEAAQIGKILSLKDFSCDYDTYKTKRQCDIKFPTKNCTNLKTQIQNRNQIFNNTRFRCKLKDNNLYLEPYQETVYKIMKYKIENSITLNRMQNPGLLVWFGTGTGKTLAASIVAKMFGYCMNFNIIKKVIIISPKSAFTNFKKELENRLKIMMNKFFKQDDLLKKRIEESFYFHGKNTNIFLFTHPIFEELFMNDDGKVNDDSNNYFNKSFLNDSLLIVDECHNFTAYGPDGPKKSTIFMSDCCKTAKQVLLLTATPIVNTPFDLEIILSYLDARDIIYNKNNFISEYFGKFDQPFFRIGQNVININENHLSLEETFNTNQNWGNINNKIGIIPSKNEIFINKIKEPSKSSLEIQNYFSNRIIYYMTENEKPSPLPEYSEKIYYIFWNTQFEYDEYNRKFAINIKIDKGNKEKENTNAFNTEENNYIWKNTNIMPNSVLNIIKTRESLSPEQEIVSIGLNININLKNKFITNSYKYIIFCNFTQNIDLIKEFLSTYIDKKYIGTIIGKTSAEERKNIASKYDEGIIKIVILSKAGEEGVDFKRTGVIILADGVWTSAEYDQILGRAVRKNSNIRLNNGVIDDKLDPNTLIPNKIECITLILSSRYQKDSEIKYSGDLRQFKIILNKRAITKQVTNDISNYFYKIIDRNDMITVEDEKDQNETFNDGKKRRSKSRKIRSKSKSRKIRSKSRKRRSKSNLRKRRSKSKSRNRRSKSKSRKRRSKSKSKSRKSKSIRISKF